MLKSEVTNKKLGPVTFITLHQYEYLKSHSELLNHLRNNRSRDRSFRGLHSVIINGTKTKTH